MRVIESDLDTFRFERAFVAGTEEVPRPVAVISGVECTIETEPGPLRDGLAFCQPLNPRLAADWPVSVLIEKDGIEDRRWNMTAEPAIVAAARRFQELFNLGHAKPGMAL